MSWYYGTYSEGPARTPGTLVDPERTGVGLLVSSAKSDEPDPPEGWGKETLSETGPVRVVGTGRRSTLRVRTKIREARRHRGCRLPLTSLPGGKPLLCGEGQGQGRTSSPHCLR